jgi:hypothetical protein
MFIPSKNTIQQSNKQELSFTPHTLFSTLISLDQPSSSASIHNPGLICSCTLTLSWILNQTDTFWLSFQLTYL